jgi:hypothetical protein
MEKLVKKKFIVILSVVTPCYLEAVTDVSEEIIASTNFQTIH